MRRKKPRIIRATIHFDEAQKPLLDQRKVTRIEKSCEELIPLDGLDFGMQAFLDAERQQSRFRPLLQACCSNHHMVKLVWKP